MPPVASAAEQRRLMWARARAVVILLGCALFLYYAAAALAQFLWALLAGAHAYVFGGMRCSYFTPRTLADGGATDLAVELEDLLRRQTDHVCVAAPQLGFYQRAMAVRMPGRAGEIRVLFNPRVARASDETSRIVEYATTCPPGMVAERVLVDRPRSVTIAYLDGKGVPHEVALHSTAAACAVHYEEQFAGAAPRCVDAPPASGPR